MSMLALLELILNFFLEILLDNLVMIELQEYIDILKHPILSKGYQMLHLLPLKSLRLSLIFLHSSFLALLTVSESLSSSG